jgi:protein-tyrosine phosphatase
LKYLFLEAIEEKGYVLIHCVAGISRSPTFAAAYLMEVENLSAEEAIK